MQENLREAERRIEEARRTGAEKLDLGDLALDELPASLGTLVELRELYLGRMGLDESCERKLYSGRTSAGLVELAPLSGLQGLKTLDLTLTEVTDLSDLASLKQLETLDLDFCQQITDLSPLSGLCGLKNLDLFGSGVSDLSPLSGCRELEFLDLSRTNVSDLTPLSDSLRLESLDLTRTKVREFSILRRFRNLRRLDAYLCGSPLPLAIIGRLCDNHRLEELFLDAVEGVPPEVLSRGPDDNCLPKIRTYLAELGSEADLESDLKVILLGNARVGKTQLCRRLRGEVFDESVKSTHGVQLWRDPLCIRSEGQEQTFQINWWDFGGQDIYHSTHALFLRSRAVFLILWAPHLENRDEFAENGTPLRNQPLTYWLDYVRSLAGNGSPVIVVQSQCDRFVDRRPIHVDSSGFSYFENGHYSAKTDLGREGLEALLKGALGALLEQNGALQIGAGRARVRERLYEWRREDQKREPADRQHRMVTLEEFRDLCEEEGGVVSWEHALDYFHQTGVVFYRPDLFANAIVLDQTWALDAIYAIFHRTNVAPWLRDSGRFTREDLAFLAWQKYSVEEQHLFLGLMQSCGVCFPVGEAPGGETRYVAPDLLPSFKSIRLPAWQEEGGLPTLRMEYRFFHQAVIRGLMSRIGRRAKEMAEYWKYGLWFKDGKREAQFLLQFEESSTEQAPGAGALVLRAQGRDPLGLLREIRNAILGQRIGEQPEELLTLDGTTVRRNALEGAIEGRVIDVEGKPIEAGPFAAFFAERERLPEEVRDGDRHKIDVQPERPGPGEKRPEVFISYSWDDDSPEGKLRGEVANAVEAALAEDGYAPMRDRNEIAFGERISSFIRQLTRADLVVAVISDQYLRSPYCLFEIYRLWQRNQEDANLMADCLVPIVLPEVQLKTVPQRRVYIDFWTEQWEPLATLPQATIWNLGEKTYQEGRLIREFGQHVGNIMAFVHDVLMPRRLDVQLEAGVQAVLETVRRRLGRARLGP